MSRWAVVGANGFIGSNLVAALEARNFTVKGISAPRLLLSPTATVQDTHQYAQAIHPSLDGLVQGLSGQDVVVNAAGVARPGDRASEEMFGANSALPLVLASASAEAGVRHFVHLSSAAVQGRLEPLTPELRYEPFSPYSLSKALGEQSLVRGGGAGARMGYSISIIRAASIYGPGRATSDKLSRFAKSSLSSVAGSGDSPSPLTTIEAFIDYVIDSVDLSGSGLSISMQPWQGETVAHVLRRLGGREPLHLPVWLCRATVSFVFALAKFGAPTLDAIARRLELVWFGQRIESDHRVF